MSTIPTRCQLVLAFLAWWIAGCGASATYVLDATEVPKLSGTIRDTRPRSVTDVQGRKALVTSDFAIRIHRKGADSDSYSEFGGKLYVDLSDHALTIGSKGERRQRYSLDSISRIELVTHPGAARHRTVGALVTVGGVLVLAFGNIVFFALPSGYPSG